MLDLKRVRRIDLAIAVVFSLVVLVGVYLGFSLWSQNQANKNATPAYREIEAFKADLRKNPNDIDKRMRLAQTLAMAGRDREAILQYQQVLKVKKDFIPALSGIGFELMKQKNWKSGETYFQKVIALTEGKQEQEGESPLEIAYFYTGIAAMEQHKYEDAVANLRAALRLKRDASDTAYALAVSYRELGIEDGYRTYLQYTLQFDPKMPEANYDYGLLLLKDGDIAGAAEHFRMSADSAPGSSKPTSELAKLGSASDRLAKAKSLESKDASAALVQARIAAALDPQSVPALELVGMLYEKAKVFDKATATYQKILLIDPKNVVATEGLKRVANGS